MVKATELGTESIKRLLVKYALPGIIAMTASSLYNLVDSVFIGHVCGTLALSGLTVAKPFMDICAAFGSFVGVGASTLLAIKLGEKDYLAANKILGNVIILNILLSSLVMALGLIWLDPVLLAFGASEATLIYAHEYMEVILWGNILTHIYFGLNSMLRSMGHPKSSMMATVVAVSVNVFLDYIFIYRFQMGVRGAALATIISQSVAVVWQMALFFRKSEVVHFQKGIWGLDSGITLRSFSIGLSPFLMNIAHCFVVVIINNQLGRFGGDMALASYGVVNRMIFLFAMIVMGLNQGLQPIVGYNYGAKQYPRVLTVLWMTSLAASLVTTTVFLLGELCPAQMARVFTHDQELIDATIVPMRILCASFWLVGFQMVGGNFFTSIGMAGKSIFLSLTRQVIYLIPLTLILPLFFKADPILGVWWSIPISDSLAAFTAALMIILEIRKFKQLIAEQDQYNSSLPPQPD